MVLRRDRRDITASGHWTLTATPTWDVNALTEPVDCIVLGRKLAEGFIPAWAAGPEGEDQESIDWMNNTPKVVISNTLTESPWENTVAAGGDLAETVNRLKAQQISVGRQPHQPLPDPLQALPGQRVVLHDRFGGHADGIEQHRSGPA